MNKFRCVINFPSNSGNYLGRYHALEDYKIQIYINIIVNINISHILNKETIFFSVYFSLSL